MKKLRSFVYLDNYKMYSISSQLFEGLTEYIVRTQSQTNTEEESQKGPVASGRLLADIIEKNTNETEKKFLHDYSYNLFEDTLIKEERVLELNADNIDDGIKDLSNFSFVKVSGHVVFNDLKAIEDTIRNFNDIGEAFGYLSQKEAHDNEIENLRQTISEIKDRNQKAKANALIKSKLDFKKVLKEKGLNLDGNFLKHLAYILDYGYNQQFEVQVPVKSMNDNFYLFSAQLKRQNLKDDEMAIVKKYSRETEKEFKLFGIVTQRLTAEGKMRIYNELKLSQEGKESQNMKEALMNMVTVLTNLEQTFTGKMNYEYVIDPISLYIEI